MFTRVLFRYVLAIILAIIIVFIVLPIGLAQNTTHQPLVEANEVVLFSFAVENSTDILTIATAQDGSYIVYRFGEEGNVKLEYPTKTEDSWEQFIYSHYSRAVGNANALLDLNYLEFTSGDSKYFVYDSFSEEFIKSFVGVTITSLSTGEERNFQAASQVQLGNLSRLQLNSKIKSQSALKAKVPTTPGKTIVVQGDSGSDIALAALQEDVLAFESEITGYIASAQQSLSNVESAFNQLIADTVNTQTRIAYWTVENEADLETVRARAQTITSNQQAVNELISQFELANAIESKTEYLTDISAYNERIKALAGELELLENTAINGFDTSRTIYREKIQNNSNNNQDDSLENLEDTT